MRKDKEMKGYTKQRREAVIAKMTGPNRRSIAELVKEEQICAATLYKWRRQRRTEGRVMPDGDDTPEGWGARDKFNAVLEKTMSGWSAGNQESAMTPVFYFMNYKRSCRSARSLPVSAGPPEPSRDWNPGI